MEFEETNSNEFVFYLTQAEKEKLKQNSIITEITSRIKKIGEFDSDLAENDSIKNWNTDNYGPIYIPEKVVDEELFFVLGDNRHNAVDSRYIGLISKTKIVGIIMNK